MQLNKIFLLSTLTFCLLSCRKFVEKENVQNTRTLTSTNDYRLLVNATATIESATYTWPGLSGDDVYFTDSAYQANFGTYYAPMYTWTAPYFTADNEDLNWSGPYGKIYTFNTVIQGVMSSTDGTDKDKSEIKGEALIHRAFAYWALVNCYGKEFDSSTASSDPGVPLILEPDLYTSLKRATIKTVYDQIITDIKDAIPTLDSTSTYNVYPSRVAAYALLSRIYLFTRNFTLAKDYADSALGIYSTLVDYNTYVAAQTIPKRLADQELLLSKIQSGYYYPLQLNPELVTLLGTTDLRYQLFTQPGSYFGYSSWGTTARGYSRLAYNWEGNNIGLTTPELYLIKAECYARAGNISASLDELNQLRIKRYATADYVPATATTALEALKLVVDERKKEFFGRGYRWFDQKRYNKDADLQITVTRKFQGVTYTLAPNDNKYVYPIGEKYIEYNPEIEQNPE